jgi:hypothetical protein
VRKQTCKCGAIPGKNTILHDVARVGITTRFRDNGTFLDNEALYVWNNYCPQCGAPYEIIEDGQKKLFPEEGIA